MYVSMEEKGFEIHMKLSRMGRWPMVPIRSRCFAIDDEDETAHMELNDENDEVALSRVFNFWHMWLVFLHTDDDDSQFTKIVELELLELASEHASQVFGS